MAKNRNSKSTQSTKKELESQVIDFFNRENHVPYNYKQVSAALGADTPKRRSAVVEILEELALEGFLVETTPGKFTTTDFQYENGILDYVTELAGEDPLTQPVFWQTER